MYDYVIVGAGLTGATCATVLANDLGKKVLVIDSKDQVGGTCGDKVNQYGQLAPLYGPHAFHTNSKKVWDFLSNFTEWKDYTQVSLTRHKNELYEIPINATTIEKYFGIQLSSENLVQRFLGQNMRTVPIHTGFDLAMQTMGSKLYKAFYAGYTAKQWDCDATKLHRSVIGRIPVRTNRDNRYFNDKYQAMPKAGYTAMVEKMLQEIPIQLNTKITLEEALQEGEKIIWTGPLDEAFNNKYGPLEWRSLYWKEERSLNSQKAAVIHEADIEIPWTRCTDVSYFCSHFGNGAETALLYEYSSPEGEKFYPILRPHLPEFETENEKIRKYHWLANNRSRTVFLGRMGRHNYINMDQAVSDALSFMGTINVT